MPAGGGAARAAGHVRLRRRRRPDGRGAPGRGRASRSPIRAVIRKRRCAPASSVVVEGQNQLRPGAKVQRAAGQRAEQCGARRRAARGAAVSISEPFIRRPVATDAADGRPAARGHARRIAQLPVSALPQVDYPTIVVSTHAARRERRDDGLGGDHAARAAVRADAVARADDLGVELRQLADHAAVHARSQHRRRRAGRAGGDQRRVEPAAAHAAGAADLPQEQPRRRADPDARASAPTRCRSPQVDDYADSILAQKISQVSGVGLVTHQRRAEAGGARAGRSGGARRHRPHARGRAARRSSPPTSTSPRATSTARARTTRSPPTISSTTPTSFEPLDHRLQERRADPAARRRRRHRRRRERAARRLGQRPARHHPQRAAPAGRQRHRGRRPREGAACRSSRRRCPQGIDVRHPQRPHRDRARLGRGRAVHAGAHDRPGGRGDLRLPAQPARDHHPRRRGAAVADRHLRRDVPAAATASTTCR